MWTIPISPASSFGRPIFLLKSKKKKEQIEKNEHGRIISIILTNLRKLLHL